jgi:23S rRNA G2069 N7-methylase RlmK/C1962 C5-methylase RlmI
MIITTKCMKREADGNGDECNIIILDPPKLAATIRQLDCASRNYQFLNRDGIKLIDKKERGVSFTM